LSSKQVYEESELQIRCVLA